MCVVERSVAATGQAEEPVCRHTLRALLHVAGSRHILSCVGGLRLGDQKRWSEQAVRNTSGYI